MSRPRDAALVNTAFASCASMNSPRMVSMGYLTRGVDVFRGIVAERHPKLRCG